MKLQLEEKNSRGSSPGTKKNSRKTEDKSRSNQSQRAGLKKLKKRVKEGSVIEIKTDKTGRLAATTREDYKKGGKEHTQKDRIITREETEKIQR